MTVVFLLPTVLLPSHGEVSPLHRNDYGEPWAETVLDMARTQLLSGLSLSLSRGLAVRSVLPGPLSDDRSSAPLLLPIPTGSRPYVGVRRLPHGAALLLVQLCPARWCRVD